MRIFMYACLYTLLGIFIALLCYIGIDMAVAQRDYVRMSDNGDYEQKVEGCIFDWVCERFTKELQK